MQTREQLLNTLKYIVRTVCLRHNDSTFDALVFIKSIDIDNILESYVSLSSSDALLLQKEFDIWLQSDMIKYKEIIENIFDFKKIFNSELKS